MFNNNGGQSGADPYQYYGTEAHARQLQWENEQAARQANAQYASLARNAHEEIMVREQQLNYQSQLIMDLHAKYQDLINRYNFQVKDAAEAIDGWEQQNLQLRGMVAELKEENIRLKAQVMRLESNSTLS